MVKVFLGAEDELFIRKISSSNWVCYGKDQFFFFFVIIDLLLPQKKKEENNI